MLHPHILHPHAGAAGEGEQLPQPFAELLCLVEGIALMLAGEPAVAQRCRVQGNAGFEANLRPRLALSEQFGRAARKGDPPPFEEDDLVAEALDLGHVVAGQEDGAAALFQPADLPV